MSRTKHQTEAEISDKVAADVLRGGGQFGPEPTHSSMATPPPDGFDDTDNEDGAQEDGDDWNEDKQS